MRRYKLLTVILCAVLLLTIVACNKDSGTQGTEVSQPGDASPNSSGDQSPSSSSATVGGATPAGGSSVAPGGSSATEGANTLGRDTLTIAIAADQGTLSPAFVGSDIWGAMLCIFEQLWDVTTEGEMIWLLAESVDEVAPDRYTVHIRPGVKFSNGATLTAYDVLFSMEIYKNSGSTGAPRVQTVDFDRTNVIDDLTLDLYLLDFHVAHWTVLSEMLVYHKDSYNPETASNTPIGTGPYVVDEYVVNSHLFLKRRDDYWGDQPAIPNLRFRVLAETSQVVNAIETGMVDIGTVQSQDYEYVSQLSGYEIRERYAALWLNMSFNPTDQSIMHNPEARYAVAHAIDRQAILDIVYYGRGRMMYNPVSAVVLDYEPRFDNLHTTYSEGYNVALAKQYADSSGLTGQTIRIVTNGTATHVIAAEIIQNMLKEIGVTVSINNYDVASFASVSGDASLFDIRIAGGICPNYREADPLVNGVRYSAVLSAPGSWDDLDKYLEIAPKALNTPDPQERSDITYEALKLYTNACIVYPLCDTLSQMAFSEDIAGPFIYRVCGSMRFSAMSFK